MEVKTSYDEEKDLIIYKDSHKTSKLVMEKNDLAIYYPEDVHMGIAQFDGESSLVYKTVVKVQISELKD